MGEFPDSTTDSGLELSTRLQVDRHCRSFERLWGTPQRQSIEAALAAAPKDSADELLHELVAIEVELRCRQGEQPTLTEYQQRFPTAAETVAKAFAEAAADVPSSTLEPQPLPERLGEYRIVREIGRGGMGVVYEAIQESLQRPVALKLLPIAAALNPTGRQRFRQEALTAAKLKHPNIVSIYDAGTQDGTPYIAMELIDGESLASLLRTPGAAQTSPRNPNQLEIQLFQPQFGSRYQRIAQIGRDIARALEFAHTHRVLHRDVKPSNLLLDRHGIVRLADFGVARSLDDDGSLTISGEFLGTLRYAAPETLEGQFDRRSDLYSLGVTLYELISRGPAFSSPTRESLLDNILRGNPQPWPAAVADCPRDLKTIIRKSMASEPRERYPSAGELAQDLDLFLQGRPIRARRPTARDHFLGWCRRQPLLAMLVASLFFTLTVGLIATTWLLRDAVNSRNLMAEEQTRALRSESRAITMQAELQHQDALVHLEARNDGQALGAVVAALQLAEEPPQTADAPSIPPSSLSFVEANRYLAATLQSQMPFPVARNTISDRVAIWTQTNRALKLGRDLPALTFHDDGQSIDVGSRLGADFQHWDLTQDSLKPLLQAETAPGVSVHYLGPTQFAVVQTPTRGLELWDVATGQSLRSLGMPPGHRDDGLQVLGCWLSPDSRRLLLFYFTLSAGPACRLYDVASGELFSNLVPKPHPSYEAYFSPDSKLLLTVGSVTQLWDTETCTMIRQDFPAGAVPCFTADQLLIGLPTELQIWPLDDLSAGSIPRRLPLPDDSLLSTVTCDPAEKLAVVGTADGSVWLLDLTGTAVTRKIQHGPNLITQLQLSPNGREVLIADNSGRVGAWDLVLGERSTPVLEHRAEIASLAWSPDARRFATATVNGELTVWERAEPPQPIAEGVELAVLAPNLQDLFIADQNGNVSVRNLPRGELIRQATIPAPRIAKAVWSPHSNRIAFVFGEASSRVSIWDLGAPDASPWELSLFSLPNELVETLTFTATGQRLAAFDGYTLSIHDEDAFAPQEQAPPPATILPLAPGPTSQTLLLVADEKQIIGCRSPSLAHHQESLASWDPITGEVLYKGMMPAGLNTSQILLSADSQFLFAVGEYGLQVWDTRSWQTVALPEGDWHNELLLVRQHPTLPYLATLGRDQVIRCLDYTSGKPQGQPFRVTGKILELAWSADGKLLHTATAMGGVQLWDWHRGEPLSPPLPSGLALKQAIFNPQRSEWLLVADEAPYPLSVLSLPAPSSSPLPELIGQAERLTGLTRSPESSQPRPLSLEAWRDRQRQSADSH
jgi:serine/threonine protein kinase/WD40 repeat protein